MDSLNTKRQELAFMISNLCLSLYYIVIYPIELILEVVFALLFDWRHNPGLAIIGVSIAVNILSLPLYRRADLISGLEKEKQKAMAPWISHIRRVFKGDERFMMLSAYYRKQGYKPFYALRSSIPLLMQIPFFIAAYHFLSNLGRLHGTPFLLIKDLGQPDQLILIPGIYLNVFTGPILLGELTVNVLPILMTLINIISSLIYTKGSPIKDKINLFVMALIFLILLYQSPSGLVLYWTVNNVFSLIRNIISLSLRHVHLIRHRAPEDSLPVNNHTGSYLGGTILLTVLTGLLIPSSVIVSSPAEFITLAAYRSPLQYVFSTFCVSAGFFLCWLSVFYYLASPKAKHVIRILLWIGSLISLVEFIVFGKNTSILSSELRYENAPVYSPVQCMMNTAVVLALACIAYLIWKKFPHLINKAYTLLVISLCCLFTVNVFNTAVQLSQMDYLRQEQSYSGFPLSTGGKNVVVIMLDRALGAYLPYAFTERPELAGQFSGFKYYPNTLSFGDSTLTGSGALFGGYEYTPFEIDKRADETRLDKQNEALRVMPVLFSSHGYKTTVYDPPLANMEEISDTSIYDQWPDINAYSLKQRFVEPQSYAFLESYRRRAFFMYSIYKTLPLFTRHGFYHDGDYLYPDDFQYVDPQFAENYSVLESFIALTEIEDSKDNTFMMIDNETPHSPCDLQLPDYTPSTHVNNEGLESGYRLDMSGSVLDLHARESDPYDYYAYMATLIKLGEWLDYLRDNAVYDNTRIIIVADHGNYRDQIDTLLLDDGTDVAQLNPLLMFKDFDSDTFSASFDLMSNGDTPALAVKDLIEDPVNPFTGQAIVFDDKKKELITQLVPEENYDAFRFNCTKGPCYLVRDNIFDNTNWTEIR